MAVTDFSATPVRAALARIGDPNSPTTQGIYQRFERENQFPDCTPLKVAFQQTPFCLDKANLDRLLAQRQNSLQDVFIDVRVRPTATVSNTLAPTGWVAGSTARVAVPLNTLISAKREMSRSSLQQWDAYTESMNEKMQLEFDYLFYGAIRAAINQFNTQFISYLDTAKATAGGLGTYYANSGGYKQIPNTEQNMFRGIYVDGVRSNRFTAKPDEGVKPVLLGSLNTLINRDDIEQYGQYNQRDATKQLMNFDTYDSESIAVNNSGTDQSRIFLIDRGGVGVTTWVNDYDLPADFTFNQKVVENFELPANFVQGLPAMKAAVYMEKDFVDGLATYTFAESRIDQVARFMVFFWPVMVKAYSSVANSQPIIGYTKLL